MVSKTRFKSSPSSSSSSFDKAVEFTRLLFYALFCFLTPVWASACDYKYCHFWLIKRYRINCQPENSIQTWEWYGGGYLSQPLQDSYLNNTKMFWTLAKCCLRFIPYFPAVSMRLNLERVIRSFLWFNLPLLFDIHFFLLKSGCIVIIRCDAWLTALMRVSIK